jgi:very-short-patch-repair endonuclease
MTESFIGRQQPPEKKAMARAMRREMTSAEARLWQSLRGSQLNGLKFRRQQVIDGFIADFYCHEAQLVVEADGCIHDERQEYDSERASILAARQLIVLRFPNTRIENDLSTVLSEIAATAQQRISQPTLAPLSEGEGLGVRSPRPSCA